MTKTFRGLAILALLIVTSLAFAGDGSLFSVSLNDKGGNIVLHDGKTTTTVDSLSISVCATNFNEASSVTAKFMWPEGTQNDDGSYKTIRTFDCRKLAVGAKTVWTANVEDMRSAILDTTQQLSCFFEATMPNGSKRYLSLGRNTLSDHIGFAHVDDGLNVSIGIRGPRPDGTHALDFMPRGSSKK